MEKRFKKGDILTNESLTIYKVVDSNTFQIVCSNILSGRFEIFNTVDNGLYFADTKELIISRFRKIVGESDLPKEVSDKLNLEVGQMLLKLL